jgi:ribose 5-phosphate isomerase A
VARASHRLAVVVDDGKWVPQLGTRAPLPLAVVPFGWSRVEREVAGLGADPVLRRGPEGAPVTTDDGLYIIDARFATGIADPVALEGVLAAIPGVAGTGLFLGLANVAFVGHPGLVLAMHA